MRTLTLHSVLTLTLLGAAAPALAEPGDGDDPAVTQEEVERKREEVRELERKLREQERAQDEASQRRARGGEPGRMWVYLGTGIGYGSVKVTCSGSGFGPECREEGIVNTYAANLTLSAARGPTVQLRGIRDRDKGGDGHTAYEVAALVGTRFGHSSWYGMVGYGRVYHADDRFPRDHSGGLAWEFLFAPPTDGPVGLELGFQGHDGHHVDYVAFNIGMRFGALR